MRLGRVVEKCVDNLMMTLLRAVRSAVLLAHTHLPFQAVHLTLLCDEQASTRL